MTLYLRAGDLVAAEALILREAEGLIAKGRWRIVVDWIDALPQAQIEQKT